MKRFVLVLSDIHLAPSFSSPSEPGSLAVALSRLPFRKASFSPATYLSRVIDQAVQVSQSQRAILEIVLNGDVFDFDVAQTAAEAAAATRFTDTRCEYGAVEAFARMLASHLPFVLALRRATQAGAIVVVLPGNHDAQLGFPAVRSTLRTSIGLSSPSKPGLLAGEARNLYFCPWYYLAAGGAVIVEHGHQYDPLCAVMRMQITGRERTESTVGTVSSFYAPLLFPGADPFATDPFTERGSLRSMMVQGLSNSGAFLSCAGELLVAGAPVQEPDTLQELMQECQLVSPNASNRDGFSADKYALENGESLLDYRRSFFAPKATLGQVFAVATGAFDYGRAVDANIERAMTEATDVHGAKVAVVGHTHHPGSTTLMNGALLLNSGSWTPRRTREEPVGNYAWIEAEDGMITEATVRNVPRGA